MGKALGFTGILIAMAIGAFIYSRQVQSIGGAEGIKATPQASIDIAGVKNDLIAIANAERTYFAQNSKYTSLEELRNSSILRMETNRRGPYVYSADFTDSSFHILATYEGQEKGVPKLWKIDEAMQITSE